MSRLHIVVIVPGIVYMHCVLRVYIKGGAKGEQRGKEKDETIRKTEKKWLVVL